MEMLPAWVLPLLGIALPFLVQRVPEAARVPIVAGVALAIAIVAGIMMPAVIGAQVPYLAWDLFTALAAGYTAAKIPQAFAGGASKAITASIGFLAVFGLALFASGAWAQDGTLPAEDGGIKEIAIVVISGLLGRLGAWIAKKIRK